MTGLDDLRARWNQLHREYLPSLAKARDPVQDRWPVYLDHCFARIILDEVIGSDDKPWTATIKQPAIKHMTEEQLISVIELAERIATGEESLSQLNDRSLEKRNKKRKADSDADGEDRKTSSAKKQKVTADATISSYFTAPPKRDTKPVSAPLKTHVSPDEADKTTTETPTPEPDMSIQVKRITDSDLKAYRKQILSLLCQIPRGRFSTYQALSDHVTKSSHKTCARAVGNGIRNNPFAPEVPCHRVLAADGSLGGFKGDWGEAGKYAGEKHRLLKEEGVKFDSAGKVKGRPFREFV